jgi:hypothetical protein
MPNLNQKTFLKRFSFFDPFWARVDSKFQKTDKKGHTIFLTKFIWGIKNTKFYAEFKSVEKCPKIFNRKVISQKLEQSVMKVEKLPFYFTVLLFIYFFG